MNLIIITGKSASGKDYIAQYITKIYGYHYVTSTTTRDPRVKEIEGKDYNYTTEENFINLIETEQLLEYSVTNGEYYGTPKSAIKDGNYVCVVDMQGVKSLQKAYPESMIIYIRVPDDIRLERAKKRGSFNQDNWDKRFNEEAYDFLYVERHVDHVVDNIDYMQTIYEIDRIMGETYGY